MVDRWEGVLVLCHVPNCGREQVVTITADTGSVLAHYPACSLHIVEVANSVRQQIGIPLEHSREAQAIERNALMLQMVEQLALVEREDRPFDQFEYEQWERWRRRVEHLDRMLTSGAAARKTIVDAVESQGPKGLPLPPK
jgi:hypothetical protein